MSANSGDSKVAARLKRLRNWQGFTQREVADGTNGHCSLRTYQGWEASEHQPPLGEALRAVAEFYRVAPGWILNGDKGNPHAHDGGTGCWSTGEDGRLVEDRD